MKDNDTTPRDALSDGYVRGENEANARLIAAAPDLLEAAKAARWRIANLSRTDVPFNDTLDGPVLRALDAAIAKATGEDV